MSGQNGKELANKIRFQVLTTYEFAHQLKPYQKKMEVEAGERMNNLMKRIFLPEQVVQHATLLRTGWVSIIQLIAYKNPRKNTIAPIRGQ